MQAWETFLKSQAEELGEEIVAKWLRSLKVVRFDACNLYLEAADSFQALWFEEHIRKAVDQSLKNNNQKKIRVHLSVAQEKEAGNATAPMQQQELFSPFQINFDNLDPYSTFETFISSKENELPIKLAQDLTGCTAGSQQKESSSLELGTFNPIFIYGPSGCGKSHLLMAIAKAFKDNKKNVLYAHADTFTQHVVSAIRLGEMRRFRQAYRKADLLIIDDIQIFSRKGATQEEFFHTFNTLHLQGAQIILSANCHPQQLQNIEPRLISRFEWGIVMEMEPLSTEACKHLLEQKCQNLNLQLDKNTLDFLIHAFPSGPKALSQALEAVVLRLHFEKRKNNTLLSENDIRILLSDLLNLEKEREVTPEIILKAVASQFGIKTEDVKSKSQSREHAFPRQVAMFFCRNNLKMPYMRIGELFSRDHSTVMSSVKQIQKQVEERDPEVLGIVSGVKDQLQSQR